jgi:glucoamylase
MSVESLSAWIDRQRAHAARQMLRSISPVGIVKARPGFAQLIRAVAGAVVASPVPAAYDPDPDYFFHWYRDSAIVIDALRILYAGGEVGETALIRFGEFVRFSAGLASLDGRPLAASGQWRARVAPDFLQYLRADEELARLHGDAVAADTRVNADGTLDISNWARPQNDGPALRVLTMLRWMRDCPLDAKLRQQCAALLSEDLLFVLSHAQRPCYDIWEEEQGLHYFALRVGAQALEEGAQWLASQGERARSETCLEQGRAMLRRLEDFWCAERGYYRSRILESGEPSAKELDISVVLASLHAADTSPAHSVIDPRVHATLGALDALFEADYPINHARPPARGPALGRYRGDRYYSGGAYYFSTLGAAELCYRAARGGAEAGHWLARGDRYLETVRAFTPESGDMSEQFDQRTGEQTSAKHLAWSYAAFISCAAARAALGPARGPGPRPEPAP